MKCLQDLRIHGDKMGGRQMAGINFWKIGLAILKGLFHMVLLIAKVLFGVIKLLVLLFDLIARIVIALVNAII